MIVRKKVYGPSRLLATRHRYISALKLYMLYLSDGYKRCTYTVSSLHPYITEVLEMHMDNTCHAKDKTVFNMKKALNFATRFVRVILYAQFIFIYLNLYFTNERK